MKAAKDIMPQIYENELLCIRLKNTYISPISPPSGNNKYVSKYVRQNKILIFFNLFDSLIYFEMIRLITKKIIVLINGISNKVIITLNHPILKIHDNPTIIIHNNVASIVLHFLYLPCLNDFIIVIIVIPNTFKIVIIIVAINKYNNKCLLILASIKTISSIIQLCDF